MAIDETKTNEDRVAPPFEDEQTPVADDHVEKSTGTTSLSRDRKLFRIRFPYGDEVTVVMRHDDVT